MKDTGRSKGKVVHGMASDVISLRNVSFYENRLYKHLKNFGDLKPTASSRSTRIDSSPPTIFSSARFVDLLLRIALDSCLSYASPMDPLLLGVASGFASLLPKELLLTGVIVQIASARSRYSIFLFF
ncbi:hypothetical protein LWI29_024082 [Acer saccharum]|uniref:Uncharacterized protein n=1 Tax=Acer saccharum TaxID=4024 RepID=A0AA39VZU4_ACESA|nr:hypothetical protein LWI29_024082 [Acer saccharum]